MAFGKDSESLKPTPALKPSAQSRLLQLGMGSCSASRYALNGFVLMGTALGVKSRESKWHVKVGKQRSHACTTRDTSYINTKMASTVSSFDSYSFCTCLLYTSPSPRDRG
eukprot:3969707-Amphidinium_carterae.1